MNLTDVSEELVTALSGITGLRAYAWARNSITPPAALVMLPESIEYDQTYGRGSDRIVLNVELCIGKADNRAGYAEIKPYANGSGSKSIKATLEGGTYTSCHSVTVQSAEFAVLEWADTSYLGAIFTVLIVGQGS
jgi:hypothetical protein